MADTHHSPSDPKDLSPAVDSLSVEEALPTTPALSTGVPTNTVGHAATMNNEEFARCSTCSDGLCQATVTARLNTARCLGPGLDTSSSQHTATSDLEQAFSTNSEHLLIITEPDLQDTVTACKIERTAKASMGRFNKRAYRQGHQTREFFDYQPAQEQESSDGTPEPGTAAVSGDHHRGFVKGIVQKCPGADNCADCKEGRSAPVYNNGSGSVSADVRSGVACSSVPKTGRPTIITTGIRVCDMYQGLTHSRKDSMEATAKSKSSVRTDSEGLTNHWEVFMCLTDRLRRKAAEHTILHLAHLLDLTEIDNKDSTARDLPFLNENQLAQMIGSAMIRHESGPKFGKPNEPDTSLGSSNPMTIAGSVDQKAFGKGENMVVARSKEGKKVMDVGATEEQVCAERGRIWADLLVQENRRMKMKWFSEMEKEGEGNGEGASVPESVERKKKIYEALKAEDEARLKAKKSTEVNADDDVDSPIKVALQSNAKHSERYRELLANPSFIKVARRSLKDWCVKNGVPAQSSEAMSTYLSLLQGGEEYPKHAWDSALPPVWDAAGKHWIWHDFSKANKGKDMSGSGPGSQDEGEANKDLVAPHDEEGEAKAVTLTKSQKRAKARKEKRKAQKGDAGIVQDAAINAEIPSRTDEEFQQAIDAASVGIKEALASRVDGPSTSTETVTMDGETYRVPAAGRVSLSTAINLATTGRLRIHMCPTLGKGDADRLLKASHRFQSGIDSNQIGKDPHVITKFLMKVGMRPSEYEGVMELDNFLKVMKQMDELGVEHSHDHEADDVAAGKKGGEKETGKKGERKGKGKSRAATAEAAAPTVETAVPVAYPPPPPRPRHRDTVVPWAVSLTPAQIKSLSHTDRWIHLRGVLFNARSFISSAARLLTEGMLERLLHPAAGVLTAPDLPIAQYRLGRTITFTRTMQDMYAKYEAEKARKPPGTPIKDYVTDAVKDLNTRYEKVEEMVAWARRQVGREHVDLLRLGPEEAMVRPGMGPSELLSLAEQAASGEAMGRLAAKKAEGLAEFLGKWPQLEGVVTGEVGRYVPA